ncbi:MAG: NAD regulator, partial [Salaquimonas sp.]|nr:NAD regulator [Salaquimonas sp.]
LVENAQLVEPTGATSTATGGRPAALFRFRRDVLAERPAPGLRVGRRG